MLVRPWATAPSTNSRAAASRALSVAAISGRKERTSVPKVMIHHRDGRLRLAPEELRRRIEALIEAAGRREAEAAYPKIRGAVVPADIFDEVVTQLKAFRIARDGEKR
jgi:hypothetical protein